MGNCIERIALQWVQKYIRSFGGDPSKVTMFVFVFLSASMISNRADITIDGVNRLVQSLFLYICWHLVVGQMVFSVLVSCNLVLPFQLVIWVKARCVIMILPNTAPYQHPCIRMNTTLWWTPLDVPAPRTLLIVSGRFLFLLWKLPSTNRQISFHMTWGYNNFFLLKLTTFNSLWLLLGRRGSMESSFRMIPIRWLKRGRLPRSQLYAVRFFQNKKS